MTPRTIRRWFVASPQIACTLAILLPANALVGRDAADPYVPSGIRITFMDCSSRRPKVEMEGDLYWRADLLPADVLEGIRSA